MSLRDRHLNTEAINSPLSFPLAIFSTRPGFSVLRPGVARSPNGRAGLQPRSLDPWTGRQRRTPAGRAGPRPCPRELKHPGCKNAEVPDVLAVRSGTGTGHSWISNCDNGLPSFRVSKGFSTTRNPRTATPLLRHKRTSSFASQVVTQCLRFPFQGVGAFCTQEYTYTGPPCPEDFGDSSRPGNMWTPGKKKQCAEERLDLTEVDLCCPPWCHTALRIWCILFFGKTRIFLTFSIGRTVDLLDFRVAFLLKLWRQDPGTV
ncbi:uncharacterized protein [Oryctolagus cuniculus]|uniref:uncharacterized protein isoform X3 n=1 Tax=Oryctolagus cuniculus TaxID=9986 RepID=UPI00387A7E6B